MATERDGKKTDVPRLHPSHHFGEPPTADFHRLADLGDGSLKRTSLLRRTATRVSAALALATVLVSSSPARSQTTQGTAVEAVRVAQYVLLIDDSGSMSKAGNGLPATDTDRLAVFAVDSLLSLLDDTDEATVLRLGATADSEEPVGLGPLSEQRARLKGKLDLGGKLASYAAGNTDCAGGFEQAARVLNASYRQGVPQVMIFLTDGECNTKPVVTNTFLSSVKSHQDDAFQFHLITFAGRPSTRSLGEVATATGGGSYSVREPDPTAILEPFAKAVSRSQGYDAYLLTPSDNRLAAHKAAKRVRLLAVAPGEGVPLGVSLTAGSEGTLPVLDTGKTVTGTHRYQSGRPFRFVRAWYRPAGAAVKVNITSGGVPWKVIAIPEYRLHLETSVSAGVCEGAGSPVQAVDVGTDACVTVSLTNESGTVLDANDLGSRPEIGVVYQAPGQSRGQELPASPSGTQLMASMPRRNLVAGDHVFRPYARCSLGGAEARIKGQPRTLQVSSRQVTLEPRALSVGDLVPGGSLVKSIVPKGSFQQTRARVTLNPPDSLPKCVKFTVAGKPLGEAFPFSPENPVDLRVDVDGYCGPAVIEKALGSSLRFEFDASSNLPARELPLDGNMRYRIAVPAEIVVSIDGGRYAAADFVVTSSGAQGSSIPLRVLQDSTWPEDDLTLGFPNEEGRILERDGAAVRDGSIPIGPQTARLVVKASACCAAGEHLTRIAFGREGGDPPLYVPVRVRVTGAGVWACYGERGLMALSGFLVLLVFWFFIRMYLNTFMLQPKKLGLKPLFAESGSLDVNEKAMRQVANALREKLGLFARLAAFKAVPPFKAMFTGDYRHTVSISLDELHPRLKAPGIVPVEHRDLLTRATKASNPLDAGARKSTLYATATKTGVVFWTVVGSDMKVGKFDLVGDYDVPEEGSFVVVRLRGADLIFNGEGSDDPAWRHAGWRVG